MVLDTSNLFKIWELKVLIVSNLVHYDTFLENYEITNCDSYFTTKSVRTFPVGR